MGRGLGFFSYVSLTPFLFSCLHIPSFSLVGSTAFNAILICDEKSASTE